MEIGFPMHRFLFTLIFVIFLAGYAGASVQIVEFCPDPYLADDTDEYVVLAGSESLDGITISDGEGGFRFPPGTWINGKMTIARNGHAFLKSHGQLPDYEWMDYSPDVPDVIRGDPLRLANARDELMLYKNGNLVQNIIWPGTVRPREGQIHYLENDVWDPRPLMIGQSWFTPEIFHNVSVTTFVSPDCSSDVFIWTLNRASEEILLNVYEFSSPIIADALVTAKNRGVNVTVLVEGGPVGGISPEEKAVIRFMTDNEIPVSAMLPAKGDHAPYRYDHAKYTVVDERLVLITSENFKYSGFPPQGVSANRGWGVVLDDPGIALYYSTVFTTDMASPSVVHYTGSSGTFESVPTRSYTPEFSPESFSGATVRPVIAPDTSYQITDLMNSAQQSIEIEQAYITNETEYDLNPYLSAAINASRRGVAVRVLLDSYYYNIEDEKDNDEMAALINTIGRNEQIPLEARCADLAANNLEKIHNKGAIVDDRAVLVSSINWNSNSPNFNRESGVIVEHPGVARYFKTVFEDDWNASPVGKGVQTDWIRIAVVGLVILLLVVLYYYRHLR